MKTIAEDFEIARAALLDAATAVDAFQPREAEQHLRTLQAWCEIIIKRLEQKSDNGETRGGEELRA